MSKILAEQDPTLNGDVVMFNLSSEAGEPVVDDQVLSVATVTLASMNRFVAGRNPEDEATLQECIDTLSDMTLAELRGVFHVITAARQLDQMKLVEVGLVTQDQVEQLGALDLQAHMQHAAFETESVVVDIVRSTQYGVQTPALGKHTVFPSSHERQHVWRLVSDAQEPANVWDI